MSACEGALLVVDCSQSVEAQTVANCFAAIDNGLEVIPVLNKIDLPAADPEKVMLDIEELIGIDARHALKVSAKTGDGVGGTAWRHYRTRACAGRQCRGAADRVDY